MSVLAENFWQLAILIIYLNEMRSKKGANYKHYKLLYYVIDGLTKSSHPIGSVPCLFVGPSATIKVLRTY